MRFSTGAPTTPTTMTSIELVDSAQGKRGSNSDSNVVTSSVSSTKLAVVENQDNEYHPQHAQVDPEHQPQTNGMKVMQAADNSTVNGGDSNHQQITTIDPDRARQTTSDIYCGVSDGSQAQLKHDGNV
jgi:hypothetical protein